MRTLLPLAAAILAFSLSAPPAAAEERTVVGTIVGLDPQARTLSVADGKGARWNFKVLPDADIDLKAFKEGDRVSVSIARATPLNMMTSADFLRKGDKIVKVPY
ncbi:MAG: hypothetical protein HZA60_08450 [Deltaproteobacteria bacterium]|nr:hypothetical protein [Deltaproteobacteria bacterium]